MVTLLWLAALVAWLAVTSTFALLCTVATTKNESRFWGALVIATIAAGIIGALLSDPPAAL